MTKKTAKPTRRTMALADVIPADYNPRSITDDALAGLGASVEQFGYLQDLVFNERTGTLVAGHQRLKVLLEQDFDEAEVTVVDLDEQQERALNVTLNNPRIQGDWTADAVDLLEGMDFELPELGDLNLDGLLEDLGDVFPVTTTGFPTLPTGGRGNIQQMTFTLTDDQVAVVKAALVTAKEQGKFGDTGNQNSNGNALARICGAFDG